MSWLGGKNIKIYFVYFRPTPHSHSRFQPTATPVTQVDFTQTEDQI